MSSSGNRTCSARVTHVTWDVVTERKECTVGSQVVTCPDYTMPTSVDLKEKENALAQIKNTADSEILRVNAIRAEVLQ